MVQSDNEIEVIHKIHAKILQNYWPERSQALDLKSYLIELTGVFQGLPKKPQKILFLKIVYPTLKHLFNQFSGVFLNDGDFLSVFISTGI